jgi:hypothetical protein
MVAGALVEGTRRMLTVVCGQPAAGVTTVTVLYARSRQATVVEANPAGGDMWAWAGIAGVGLSRLATAVLRDRGGGLTAGDLSGCAAPTRWGVPVVAAPGAAGRAAACVAITVGLLPGLATGRDLVVDAGRVDPAGHVWRLLPWADRVLLLVLPTAAGQAQLARALPRLRQVCAGRLQVAVANLVWAGPPRYWAGRVAAGVGLPVVVLPFDPRSADAVAAGILPPAGRRRWWWARRRWPLAAAVDRLATGAGERFLAEPAGLVQAAHPGNVRTGREDGHIAMEMRLVRPDRQHQGREDRYAGRRLLRTDGG